MKYFEQSPELKHSGENFQSTYGWGKANRTHELEAAINNCLGDKEFAMAKIMYFLTGNADGFRVSEKTICERCNISESGYKKARKKLANKQWIFHKQGEYIQVNYNKIYSDYRALKPRGSQETLQSAVSEQKDSVKTTHVVLSDIVPHLSEYTRGGYIEDTYNIINNNINNTINKNIRGENSIKGISEDTPSAAATAAAPGASSQPLRGMLCKEEDERKRAQEMEKMEKELEKWIL